jgi:probable phosphoglycerate mutase
MRLIVEFDGGSRGNPGASGCGVVLRDGKSKRVLGEKAVWLGPDLTNNEAEHNAALWGARLAARLAKKLPISKVVMQGDSQLVIRQLDGKYKVRATNLIPIADKVRKLLAEVFPAKCTYVHVLRSFNSAADELANIAMDKEKSLPLRWHKENIKYVKDELARGDTDEEGSN